MISKLHKPLLLALKNNDNNNGHQRANLHNNFYTVNNIHNT